MSLLKNAEGLAVALWAAYAMALFKLILLDDWGTITAGIGDLPIEGTKVGGMCLLPFIAISYFVWTWRSLSRQGFWALLSLITYMVLGGPAAYVYLLRLQVANPIVQPNGQWLHFSMASVVFGVLISGLYWLCDFLERAHPDGDDDAAGWEQE